MKRTTNPGYSPVQKISSIDSFNQANECKVRFQQGDGFHQDIKLHQYEEFHLYDEFHQNYEFHQYEDFHQYDELD